MFSAPPCEKEAPFACCKKVGISYKNPDFTNLRFNFSKIGTQSRFQTNSPFPSYGLLLCQNEPSCETILTQMGFTCKSIFKQVKLNSFLYKSFCAKTCFETEANQNSEMGYFSFPWWFEKSGIGEEILILYENFCPKTCFETEANQNSEMGYFSFLGGSKNIESAVHESRVLK